jgi:hypothetical protein
MAAGPVIVIASSFTNVAYERLPLDDEDQLQMQSGGSGSRSGVSNNENGGAFGGDGGLPFFNLPLNMPPGNHVQMPVDGWTGGNSGPRQPF